MATFAFGMRILGNDREQAIVNLFRRGDASAMEMLYSEYANYLTAICARYISDDDDVRDVLQESFIKIFTTIGKFDYRGVGSLKAWIGRIVVNESLQWLRQRSRSPIDRMEADPPDLPDDDPEADGLTANELANLVRQLPDGYRTVLNLYVVEGKSHKEIARLLDIKPDTSASQLHRARNMLARIIKDYKRNRQ